MWVNSPKDYMMNLFSEGSDFALAIIGRKQAPIVAKNLGARSFYYPTKDEILQAVRILASRLESIGYTKEDYIKIRKDCNIYSRKMAAELYDILLDITKDNPKAQGREIFVYEFTYPTGRGTDTHRVVIIVSNLGKPFFIDTYPIFDKGHDTETGLIRDIPKELQKRGTII